MLQIEMVDPDRLIPYLRNARTHSQEQVEQIAASMRRCTSVVLSCSSWIHGTAT